MGIFDKLFKKKAPAAHIQPDEEFFCPVCGAITQGVQRKCTNCSYLEGFIHPQAEWSIDELAQQAAKLPQGEERKLVAAQLVRIVGVNARKGWKDNNLVPEIFKNFSAVMPQKDNLRMMWAGLLK